PQLRDLTDQSYTLNAIALALDLSGEPGRARSCYERAVAIEVRQGNRAPLASILRNLSDTLRVTGALHAAEAHAFRAVTLTDRVADGFGEGVSLYWIGLLRATRDLPGHDVPPRRSLQIWRAVSNLQNIGLVSAYLAQAALWRGDPSAARPLA